ncbi:MAG: cobalamin biosynthesis protein CbiG [Thermodesulfatator sp.]|nr:MAG: cobalamin biosynthesis protein CbiG [Thermodesulfatator sp.]
MKIAILAITDKAQELADMLAGRMEEGAVVMKCRGNTVAAIQQAWRQFDALICIMATGIVIRAIAPLVLDKKTDPAVLVVDQNGRFVIPVLSGHLGGANDLALKVARHTGGQAVITTASDVSGHTALDLWISAHRLQISNPGAMAPVMARLVNTGKLNIYSDCGLPELPPDLARIFERETADIVITIKASGVEERQQDRIFLHPPALVAGIGCNRGTAAEMISAAVQETCLQADIAQEAIFRIASIDIKKDEKGLVEFALQAGVELRFFSAGQLNTVHGIEQSDVVKRATGAKGVCEPAAILASGGGTLLVKKQKWKDVTTAIARVTWPWWEQGQGR